MKIGIVGCGAIGTSLALFIKGKLKDKATLVAVYDCEPLKAQQLVKSVRLHKGIVVPTLNELITASSLVIECAHARASLMIARQALSRGRSVMVMSVGGIANSFGSLKHLAGKKNAHLYIPSGALAGIDALKSLRLAGIKEVTLTTRKNPKSLRGVDYIARKGINLDKLSKDYTIFSGPARDAVRFFPQNINVAAVLSIAGIGIDKTRVKIVASPSIKRNIHEVEVRSKAGVMISRTENTVHPANPKTSYLAVLSASSMLQDIVEPATIGT